jgi:hypothetical protein
MSYTAILSRKIELSSMIRNSWQCCDLDRGSGVFGLWIRIQDKVFPDLGSLIPNPYFLDLVTIFCVQNNFILCQLAQKIFLYLFKNKNSFLLL